MWCFDVHSAKYHTAGPVRITGIKKSFGALGRYSLCEHLKIHTMQHHPAEKSIEVWLIVIVCLQVVC